MKIGIISPSIEFTRIAEEVSKQTNIPVFIRQGALKRGLAQAKNLIEKHGVSVIVARGATATFLDEKLSIPVVKIKVNGFDLLKTFKQAQQLGNKIVFIDSKENHQNYDLKLLEELFSIQIILRQYQDEKDITNHIKDVAESKIANVIVGTAECLANTALKKGIKSYIVDSARESILDALNQAVETYYLYEKEKLRQTHLEAIISYAFDGVIATGFEGRVFVYNEIAEKLIGLKASEVIGRKLEKIHHPFLQKLYGDGETVEKKIVSLGSQRLVVNRIKLAESEESFVITFQEVNKLVQLDGQLRRKLHNKRFFAKHTFNDIIHESAVMQKTITIAKQFSRSGSSIFINGESGTGKELFAQSIHNESLRKEGPFVAVNCAALPRDLLESELFGYEEGAFTGAKKGGKPGLFEMAHQGTLFLDEIGELSLDLQSRLLRVLQEKEVMRIGGEKIIPVNVRIISASNKRLKHLVAENEFREDLYYRLNILQIKLPPLRERKEDLFLLIKHILGKNNIPFESLDSHLLFEMMTYNWPGNIRELENVLERVIVMKPLIPDDIRDVVFDDQHYYRRPSTSSKIEISIGSMKDMEGEIIRNLYQKYDGNKQEVAQLLGVSRTTVWKKIKELEKDLMA
ncbi:sigma 54-interacting transcriptional regulator [Alkalihalobacillus sp. AL-G]|uniref:sigma 54-interacting transcriptional regulator n=1 Tax=Alkalihalobacillus sp. AL-G TaxID=2926399 RepID=UPI00272CCA0C|nr:sigma 54-interacting transcriptional regulator [Alkalihalobacillus sp. AL-G]WLD93082.1 sigma 54-interacting transcriptional regulator [Alkalihalobacillus sp. AL-G]